MTVCIAAACEDGELVVTATDSLMSTDYASGECVVSKMSWRGPWQFLYSGDPAQVALIHEEIMLREAADRRALSRRRIQATVRESYIAVMSRWSSYGCLSPFNMTIEDFKANGLRYFAESTHQEIATRISKQSTEFWQEMVVIGWGLSKHACMIYQINNQCDQLHTELGFTAIGSGGYKAQSALLFQEQSRSRTLAETIYRVASAKFASENSPGVGKEATIHIGWKPVEGSSAKPPGFCIADSEVGELRGLYENENGVHPEISDESMIVAAGIAANPRRREMSNRETLRLGVAVMRDGIRQSALQDPQSTMDDQ